jgi:flagellar assembly factor FliW
MNVTLADTDAEARTSDPLANNAPHVIDFPNGLPGFENCRRFVLVASRELEPFSCLQALDGSRPSFLTINPAAVDPEWHDTLASPERARLDVRDEGPLLWLAAVTISAEGATANLRAPFVINPRRMLGCQLIRDESPYSTRLPIKGL